MNRCIRPGCWFGARGCKATGADLRRSCGRQPRPMERVATKQNILDALEAFAREARQDGDHEDIVHFRPTGEPDAPLESFINRL